MADAVSGAYRVFMPKTDVRKFLVLLIGWMAFIFLLMTPEVMVVDRGYLGTSRFAVQYGLFGLINFSMFWIAAFYITPKYFQTKKYTAFFIICIAAILVFGIFKYGVGRIFDSIVLQPTRVPGISEFHNAINFIFITVRNSACSILIGIAYRSFVDWIVTEKRKRELEAQKHASEMAFLKMQVNPHFLFNALNNLYSLATLEKSSSTASGIMKLSDMFRYMLYEKEDSNNHVSLLKEIAFLNNFIDLVKLRYADGVNIQFSIEGNVNHQRVPPLLLFPLLENACKHGILNDPEKPVVMELAVAPKELSFCISNHINNYLKDKAGGIGLENVQKRLALLYPNKNVMQVEKSAETFRVEIKLPL